MRKRMLILCTALIITVPLSGAGAADKPPAGILYTQPLKSVLFSHGDHLQKGTSCSTCHSGLFDMGAAREQKISPGCLARVNAAAPTTAGRPLPPDTPSARTATWEPWPYRGGRAGL